MNIFLIILTAAIMLSVGFGCRKKKIPEYDGGLGIGNEADFLKQTKNVKPFAAPTTNAVLSRQAIEQRLITLAQSSTPKLSVPIMSAMCYAMAPLSMRAEYVCPACGSRTLYATPQDRYDGPTANMIAMVEWIIPSCRRLITEIHGLDVKLDETQFCRTCRPHIKTPQLVLVIHYANDNTPTRSPVKSPEDLELIREFLEGLSLHNRDSIWAKPLKDNLPRLSELLKVPVPAVDSGK